MEKYIEKCISSLIIEDKELMKRLDVIVVNDGSKDRSSELAHQFANKYPDSIRVIDKQNGNYGSCINAALPLVQGKYVRVLDADDTYNTETLTEYLKCLENCDADLIVNKFCKVDPDGNVTEIFPTLPEKFNWKAFSIKEIPLNSNLLMYQIAYKKDVFSGLGYHQTEGISYTDMEWAFIPMTRIKTIYFYPCVIYNYLLGRNGQTMEIATRLKRLEDEATVVLSKLKALSTTDKCSEGYEYLKKAVLQQLITVYGLGISRACPLDLKSFDNRLRSEYPEIYEASNHCEIPVGAFGLRMPIIKMWRKVRSKNKLKFFPKYFLFLLVSKFKWNSK